MPPFIPRKRRASTSPLESPKTKTPKRALPTPPRAESSATAAKKNNTIGFKESDSDTDSLSDIPSDQFEDVQQGALTVAAFGSEDDDDDHDDWEDAMAPNSSLIASNHDTPQATGDLELSLDTNARIPSTTDLYGESKGPSKIERQIRLHTHCMHVQLLLFHNVVRNAWSCDKEVQRILVAQLPKGVQKEVERWRVASGIETKSSPKECKAANKSKGKGRESDADRNHRDWGKPSERLEKGMPDLSRGDPIFFLLKILTAYWKKRFVITAPGLRKVGYKPPSILQEDVTSFHNKKHDPEIHGERIQDLKHYRSLAKQCQGSRDVGAQLFTALLRGLGIESRMVASLQPIGFGWSKGEEAIVKDEDVKDGETDDRSDQEMVDDGDPKPTKGKAAQSKMVKQKPKAKSVTKSKSRGRTSNSPIELSGSEGDPTDHESDSGGESVVGVTASSTTKRPSKKYDQDLPFPAYWTEVISPISNEVIPVDTLVLANAIAVSQEQLTAFEPRGAKADQAKQMIAYVVAHSQDGTVKDVTTRYLKRHMWPGKTKGVRMPVEKVPIYNKAGKVKKYEEYDWFKDTLRHYTRSSNMRTAVDDLEESKDLKVVKPEKKAVNEDVDSLQSLKSSAEFVLERFLRREEALKPGSEHVRVFKSAKGNKAKEEKVFLRKDVKRCLSAESWHKEGRKVRPGEFPLKLVPVRAVTLARKREVEEAERETGEKSKQGLYSRDQTEWIIPPPIKDGKIPKNSFGNMDCFVPSMIPKGAVHIPLRGTVKVCKKLEIDYAEAVTGFEFGNKMAVPVITGVIIAAENEDTVIDAWEVQEEAKRKKEDAKQQKLVLGTWRKFLLGLRIAERLQNEYGDQENLNVEETNAFTRKKNTFSWDKEKPSGVEPEDELMGGGGFLLEDEEDVEQAGKPSGEIIVDHGKDSEDDDASSENVSSLSKGKDRIKDTYPQTPTSLSFSSKRKAKKASTAGGGFDAGTSSSALSKLSSPTNHSEPEAVEKISKAPRSTRQRKQKFGPSEEENIPKRSFRGRGARGKEIRSHYFE